MIKKLNYLMFLIAIIIYNKSVVFATSIKEITSKEFYKLQRWNTIDIVNTPLKIQIHLISLSIIFVLLIIVTMFYIKKNAKVIVVSVTLITIILAILSFVSIFEFYQVKNKSNKIAQNIVSEINNKTYLEQRFLLKRYLNNDYGFKLDNINTDSKIMIPNNKYTLSFQTNFRFPFNFLGSIERFYKYEFTYKPAPNKSLRIKLSSNSITPIKVIETSNREISQYNTYCFNVKDLDRFNVGNNLEIIGKYKNLYTHYELDYVDLYSTTSEKQYCGKVRYNEKVYLGVDDNKVINLMEVK